MRKLVIAISTLALAASAAFADPIADRKALMKERGKLVGVLVEDGQGRSSLRRRRRADRAAGAQANAEKIDVDALVPGRQRQGRHHGLAEDLGRHGRLPGRRTTSSRPITAAAVAAPPQDVEALKAQLGTIGADCGGCHETYRIKKG